MTSSSDTASPPAHTMAMPKPRKMEFTLKVDPDPPRGFLALPPEIRRIIYRDALVEMPLWDKRHKAACADSPRNCDDWEMPPFTSEWRGAVCPASARCDKRQGLGLLAVNRQIHREAAPIFWTENVHCFPSVISFIQDVGDKLRAEYRPLIRHISLLTLPGGDTSVYGRGGDASTHVWTTLSQCTGLETIEIDAMFTRGYTYSMEGSVLTKLIEDRQKPEEAGGPLLRRLRTLSLARLLSYDIHLDKARADRVCYAHLFARVARPVDLGKVKTLAAVQNHAIDFDTNFLIHVGHAIKEEVIYEYGGYRWDVRMKRRVDDSTSVAKLKLRDGTEAEMRFYGVPISAQTRLRNAKERLFADSLLRAAGRRTPAEERTRLNVERQRHERKMHHQAKQSAVEPDECPNGPRCGDCRETKNNKLREREEAERRERQEREAAEKSRQVCRAIESRKQERRRVPGKLRFNQEDEG